MSGHTATPEGFKPRHLKALVWLKDKTEPVTMFGHGDPSLTTIRDLEKWKLARSKPMPNMWSGYEITALGREELAKKRTRSPKMRKIAQGMS